MIQRYNSTTFRGTLPTTTVLTDDDESLPHLRQSLLVFSNVSFYLSGNLLSTNKSGEPLSDAGSTKQTRIGRVIGTESSVNDRVVRRE